MRSSVLCFLLYFFVGSMAKPQNVTVVGAIVCKVFRMENIHVKLMEKDFWNKDDTLAEVHTTNQGEFELFGTEDEILSIKPYLLVHHNCNVKPGCHRETKFHIPQDFIGGIYNMTFVVLDVFQYEDEQRC